MTELTTVTVQILGKPYQVSCPEEEVEALSASARYLDGKMASIKDSIPEGTLVTVWYPFYAINTPENTRFIDEVKKRTNTYPVGSTVVGYVSGKMLTQAIMRAKNPADPQSVADAMTNLEFASPVGPVKVRGCDHMALYNFYVGAIKKEASMPDGIGVTGVKAYNTTSYARSCDDIAKVRKR